MKLLGKMQRNSIVGGSNSISFFLYLILFISNLMKFIKLNIWMKNSRMDGLNSMENFEFYFELVPILRCFIGFVWDCVAEENNRRISRS